MNLRALAEKDLAFTLEADASELIFTDTTGKEYKIQGRVGDIGFGYDLEGNQISTRVVQVTYRLSSIANENGSYILPKREWTCSWQDLSGKTWTCYVTRFEPDRTIGIGRCWLSFDLQKKGVDDDESKD